MIEHNEDAIGFASLSDVINRRVKILPVASVFEGKAVSPLKGRKTANAEAIKKGFYPLTRYMYFVHLGEKPNLAQAEFIDYMRSGPVQVKLAKLGLVSLY
jgi:ABC-type phosphate transport system substrate-binding protein